jgi:hypothetical protein
MQIATGIPSALQSSIESSAERALEIAGHLRLIYNSEAVKAPSLGRFKGWRWGAYAAGTTITAFCHLDA